MSIIQTLAGIVENDGYIAKAEEDGVSFNVEGVSHRFETFGDDEGYARLLARFNIPSDVSLERLLEVANEQNCNKKAVKTVVLGRPRDGHVCFSIEMLFGDGRAWEPIFQRALTTLRQTSDEYYGSLADAETA